MVLEKFENIFSKGEIAVSLLYSMFLTSVWCVQRRETCHMKAPMVPRLQPLLFGDMHEEHSPATNIHLKLLHDGSDDFFFF